MFRVPQVAEPTLACTCRPARASHVRREMRTRHGNVGKFSLLQSRVFPSGSLGLSSSSSSHGVQVVQEKRLKRRRFSAVLRIK